MRAKKQQADLSRLKAMPMTFLVEDIVPPHPVGRERGVSVVGTPGVKAHTRRMNEKLLMGVGRVISVGQEGRDRDFPQATVGDTIHWRGWGIITNEILPGVRSVDWSDVVAIERAEENEGWEPDREYTKADIFRLIYDAMKESARVLLDGFGQAVEQAGKTDAFQHAIDDLIALSVGDGPSMKEAFERLVKNFGGRVKPPVTFADQVVVSVRLPFLPNEALLRAKQSMVQAVREASAGREVVNTTGVEEDGVTLRSMLVFEGPSARTIVDIIQPIIDENPCLKDAKVEIRLGMKE